MELRSCSKCGNHKDISHFQLYKGAPRGQCRVCKTACEARRRVNLGIKPKKLSKIVKGSKLCLSCDRFKDFGNFSATPRGLGGLACYCRECISNKYGAGHKLESKRLATAKYRAENSERWKALHRITQFNRNSRIKAQSDGTVTDTVLRNIYGTRFCHYCYKLTDPNKRTLDHVVPLIRGGQHSASNCVMACRSCNSKKRDKLVKKTTISAKIIADSLAPSGIRLTTMVVTFPRFLLPEFNTHRAFSRNASSSRAIPASKILDRVKNDPFVPMSFTQNKPGMQADSSIKDQDTAVAAWLAGRDAAVSAAENLLALGVHKQHLNRLLEPYMWVTVIVTATDWNNFFALRCHSAAQPEIQELANQMYDLYVSSQPKQLKEGEWHLPFVTETLQSEHFHEVVDRKSTEEGFEMNVNYGWKYEDDLIKRSVARCARVSYLNHDGSESTLEQDMALYDRLLGQIPIHASPAEHQAMALGEGEGEERSGNFRGWTQYRKTLDNENIDEFKKP